MQNDGATRSSQQINKKSKESVAIRPLHYFSRTDLTKRSGSQRHCQSDQLFLSDLVMVSAGHCLELLYRVFAWSPELRWPRQRRTYLKTLVGIQAFALTLMWGACAAWHPCCLSEVDLSRQGSRRLTVTRRESLLIDSKSESSRLHDYKAYSTHF